MADMILNVATKNGDGLPVDMTKLFRGVAVFGVLTIFFAFFGCVGTCAGNRVLLTLHCLSSAAFAVFFLGTGVTTITLLEGVEPVVARTVHTYCSVRSYPVLMKSL